MSSGLDENQLDGPEMVKGQLNNIKGYWDMSYGHNFNDRNMWEGQFVLYDDGWFEGIVVDPHSSYTGDRLIFGAFFPDKCIELLKATPINVSAPFLFKGKRNAKGYDGEFSVIGLLGEQPCGVSHLITQVAEKQEDLSNLEARIESFKQNMDEALQNFYGNTAKMRSQIVEIIKRNYEGRGFSKEEADAILEVTEPIRKDVEAKTTAEVKRIDRNLRRKKNIDNLPF